MPILISLFLFGALILFLRYPPITDVTTTPEDPPRFRVEPPGDVPFPARRAVLQQRAYPDLAPLATGQAVAATFQRALTAAEEMEGWSIVFREDSLGVFQAVAETRVLGFDDDVVVEVRPGNGGAEVHVRSRSRIGFADLGTNARRIRSYLEAMS